MSMNGNGSLAHESATVLENLTARTDLHRLSLSAWIGDLQAHRFLRVKPAWCPACYAEWKEQEQPLYEPLMWMLQTATVCIKHKRKLEDYCPHCQKRQTFLKADTQPGYCTQCHLWLGAASAFEVEQEVTDEMIEWQSWVVSSLEELCIMNISPGLPPWTHFFTNLASSFESRGEQSKLAEMAGLARGQFARWLRTPYTPSLENILEFCYVCNMTPCQVLTGDLAALRRFIHEGRLPRSPRSRRLFRPVDRERCLERIQAVLDGREKPCGYAQIAKELGYSSQILRYHFPQECALLTKNVQEYRRNRKALRLERVRNEIRQVTMAVHMQGCYPSKSKVSSLLSDPDLMRIPEAQAEWLTVCRELGWEQ